MFILLYFIHSGGGKATWIYFYYNLKSICNFAFTLTNTSKLIMSTRGKEDKKKLPTYYTKVFFSSDRVTDLVNKANISNETI